MTATATIPQLPTTEEYAASSDALWAAIYPVQIVLGSLEAIAEVDDRVHRSSADLPTVSFAELGELWAFVADAKVALRNIRADIAKIEGLISTVDCVRLDRSE
jgi:hypothetical protein